MTQRFVKVDKPSVVLGGGCWVWLREGYGALFAGERPCGNKNRRGKLTCLHHSPYEEKAQARKKKIEESAL